VRFGLDRVLPSAGAVSFCRRVSCAFPPHFLDCIATISVMNADETTLEKARCHVREGEQRVAEQTQRIVGLSMDGHDTKNAEEALVALEQSLTVMRAQLAAEERMHGGRLRAGG